MSISRARDTLMEPKEEKVVCWHSLGCWYFGHPDLNLRTAVARGARRWRRRGMQARPALR
jgi:hypothetical protein